MSKGKEKTEEKKSVSINLTPFERIILVQLLPNRSSYHRGILVEQIKETLSLDDEEIMKYNVTYLANGGVNFGSNGQMNSDSQPAFREVKKFEFPKQKFNIIMKALKDADKEERLPIDKKVHNLFEKITSE